MINFIDSYASFLLTPLHVGVCLILIGVVLLQTGKGADIAGVFGGAGTQTAFGPRGVENTLSRLTKYAAVIFMITSLSLSLLKSRSLSGGFQDLPERGATESSVPRPASQGGTVPIDGSTVPATDPGAGLPSAPLTATDAAAADASAEPVAGQSEAAEPEAVPSP